MSGKPQKYASEITARWGITLLDKGFSSVSNIFLEYYNLIPGFTDSMAMFVIQIMKHPIGKWIKDEDLNMTCSRATFYRIRDSLKELKNNDGEKLVEIEQFYKKDETGKMSGMGTKYNFEKLINFMTELYIEYKEKETAEKEENKNETYIPVIQIETPAEIENNQKESPMFQNEIAQPQFETAQSKLQHTYKIDIKINDKIYLIVAEAEGNDEYTQAFNDFCIDDSIEYREDLTYWIFYNAAKYEASLIDVIFALQKSYDKDKAGRVDYFTGILRQKYKNKKGGIKPTGKPDWIVVEEYLQKRLAYQMSILSNYEIDHINNIVNYTLYNYEDKGPMQNYFDTVIIPDVFNKTGKEIRFNLR